MKILIIEDNRRHQQDARELFAQFPEVEIVICETYFPAAKILHTVDGIISDLFFPYDPKSRRPEEEQGLIALWLTGVVEEPDQRVTDAVGIRVVMEARAAGIPVVLNTSIYHHGLHVDWIHDMGWPVVDGVPEHGTMKAYTSGAPARQKNWTKAWAKLQEQIERKKGG